MVLSTLFLIPGFVGGMEENQHPGFKQSPKMK